MQKQLELKIQEILGINVSIGISLAVSCTANHASKYFLAGFGINPIALAALGSCVTVFSIANFLIDKNKMIIEN